MIITAGGENIPPVLIEDALKNECAAISNAVVLGDKKKYLAVLLTLKSEPDSEGQPTDKFAGIYLFRFYFQFFNHINLKAPTTNLVSEAGSSAKNIREAIVCPKISAVNYFLHIE